jgi:hypothetical protein
VPNDPTICGATVTYSNPLAGDNCPGWTVTLTEGLPSGSIFPLGTTTVEFTVTDDFGNTTSCMFDVTVVDTEAPVITTCPPNRDIQTSSDGSGDCLAEVPNLIDELIAEDNCSLAADLTITQDPVTGTAFGGAHNDIEVVTMTVEDEAGNSNTCEVYLTVVDDEDPTIDCSAILTNRVADPGLCSFTMPGGGFDPNFVDNCTAIISHNYPFALILTPWLVPPSRSAIPPWFGQRWMKTKIPLLVPLPSMWPMKRIHLPKLSDRNVNGGQ